MKKYAASVLAALAVTAGGAGVAAAATQYVGGGTWNYGTGGGKVYSDYHHPSVNHGSSVDGKSGLVQSPCVGANIWSRASDNAKTFGGNQSFWRHC